MKRLLSILVLLAAFLTSQEQYLDIQKDPRASPFLRDAVEKKVGVYGRRYKNNLVGIAVLKSSNHTLHLFTCYGYRFDSIPLTTEESQQITAQTLDPFNLYDSLIQTCIATIGKAKNLYRTYGNALMARASHSGNETTIFQNFPQLKAAKTLYQKLAFIEQQENILQLAKAYFHAKPVQGQDAPGSFYKNAIPGGIITYKDSIIFYNRSIAVPACQIMLYRKMPEKLYVCNQHSQLIDSMPLKPGAYERIQKEGTDVFRLYRNWLEMQWQDITTKAFNYIGSLPAPVRQMYYSTTLDLSQPQADRTLAGLKTELTKVTDKINTLIIPFAETIADSLYERYHNELSEILYSTGAGVGYTYWTYTGNKRYELTNHLGNVVATVSDRKNQVSIDGATVSYYTPDVVSATDYAPFEVELAGRSYNAGNYRYGFNGKENDNEVKGQGNSIDFGGRIYDPRLGGFLSVDPMFKSYAAESNYTFAGNSPIQYTDFNGLFKISPFFVKKYPTLARILQDYLPLLKDNPQAKEGWITAIGFSNHAEGEKAFDDMVTYGTGPYVTPTRPVKELKDKINQSLNGFFEPTGNAGEFQGPHGFYDNITVNYKYLDELETTLKQGNTDKIGQIMFVVSTLIMHEGTHWGKWKHNCCEVEGDYNQEMGANFEFNAFGKRFSYENPDTRFFNVNKAKGYYNQQKGAYGTPSFGFSINQTSSYWNSKKNSPLKGGQKGDPSLKANGDQEPESRVYIPKSTLNSHNNTSTHTTSY